MSVPAQGLTDIVPPGLLAVFDAEQLQEILGGNVITLKDVPAWREHTKYEGLREDEDRVRWLWDWLESDELCSDEQRSALFKFSTGYSVLPPGGFPLLDHQFTVQDAGGDSDRLPTVYTCFNRLFLPRFSSRDELQAKFQVAIGVAEYDRGVHEEDEDDAGGTPLDEAIEDMRHGEAVVDLEGEGIGDDGVAALAEALRENESVTEVHLGNNQIGDDGVAALA